MCMTFHTNRKLQFRCVLCTLFFSTKTNTAFEMCTFHFVGLDFSAKNLQHKLNKSVYTGKEFNSDLITLVPTCPLFHCFGSENA